MAAAQNAAASEKGFRKISKFFREAKAEFKKIVWPTKKQLKNHTVVVLVMLVLSSLFVLSLDTVFVKVLDLLLQRA